MPESYSQVYVVGRPAKNNYVTKETWGQPPASQYRFRVVGTRMYGVPVLGVYYYMTLSEPQSVRGETELYHEMREWDELSDEALLIFESGLE